MQRGFCVMWLAASSVLVILAGTAGPVPGVRAAEQAPALPPPPTRVSSEDPVDGKPKKWLSMPKLPWSSTASPKSQKAASGETKASKGLSAEQQKLDGQVSIARLAERRGQTEQAELAYQNLLQKHPELVTPHHRLGVLTARRGEFAKANEHFQTALRSASKDIELLNDAGYCYYLQNRLDDAEQLYQKALTLDPNNQAVCNNVAMLLADKGRFDESLAMFQRVNSEAQAHTNLAFMLTQTGQYEQAETHFNRALTLDSTQRPAAKGLLQLAEHKKHAKLAALPSKAAPPATPAPTAGPALAADPASPAVATGDARVQIVPTASEPARPIRLTSQETITTEPAATSSAKADGAGLTNQGAQPAVLASPARTPAAEPDRVAPDTLLSPRDKQSPPGTPQAVPAPRWLEAENVSRPRIATPAEQDPPARSAGANRRGVNTRPGITAGSPRGSRYAAGPADNLTPPSTLTSPLPSEPRTTARQAVNSRLSDRDETAAPPPAGSTPPTRSAAPHSPWPPPPDMNLGLMNPGPLAPVPPLAVPGSDVPPRVGNAPGPDVVMPTTPSRPAMPNWWGGTLTPVNR